MRPPVEKGTDYFTLNYTAAAPGTAVTSRSRRPRAAQRALGGPWRSRPARTTCSTRSPWSGSPRTSRTSSSSPCSATRSSARTRRTSTSSRAASRPRRTSVEPSTSRTSGSRARSSGCGRPRLREPRPPAPRLQAARSVRRAARARARRCSPREQLHVMESERFFDDPRGRVRRAARLPRSSTRGRRRSFEQHNARPECADARTPARPVACPLREPRRPAGGAPRSSTRLARLSALGRAGPSYVEPASGARGT